MADPIGHLPPVISCSAVSCSAISCSAISCSAVPYPAVSRSAVSCSAFSYSAISSPPCPLLQRYGGVDTIFLLFRHHSSIAPEE